MTKKFKFGNKGVKRKALLAVPTCCNGCGNMFLDKVYDIGRHKVICPKCGKINAVTDFPTMDSIREMAEQYDSGTFGQLGGYSRIEDDVKVKKKAKEKFSLFKLLEDIYGK